MKSTAWLFALILFVTPLTAQESAAPFTEALDAGKALLEKGDAAAAFGQFQKSVAADAGRFEGYFYLAVASYRQGNLAAAEEYATAALAKAPEAEKPQVQEMLGVIGEKRDFERLVREGDEAVAKGLRAKAAESHRKAFLLFPKQGAVGLRAASIYADNLNQLLSAAVLWQKVIATGDTESAAAARQELNRRQEALSKLLKEHLGMMLEYKAKPQKAPLAQLEEAFPDSIELQVELAAISAQVDDVIKHLGRAAALGVDVAAVRYRKEFLLVIHSKKEGPPFRAFITDAFGADVAEAMDAVFENFTDRPRYYEFLREAAAHGQAWAMIELGDAYWHAYGVSENPAEAFHWYAKALATGDANAMDSMAQYYYWGKGTATDYSRALELWRKAAARGNANAMYYIGECYQRGQGVAASEAEAVRWWTRAADYGSWSAMTNLLEKVVREKKFADGVRWARELTKGGEDFSMIAVGWYVLGVCLRDGLGTEQNLEEARHCFKVAAKHKYPGASETLKQLQ